LTPLYNSDTEVSEGERHSGDRTDVDPGGDGWGTAGTFNFLTSAANPFVLFNDVSFEHGGIMRKRPGCDPFRDRDCTHQLHRCGLSIDTRYFGPAGRIADIDLEDLNGVPGEGDQGTARLQILQRAESGDVDAQQVVAQWVLANRARMDEMASADSIAWFGIGIGAGRWNPMSLLDGLYPNGTPIFCDPETARDIGPWSGPGHNRTNEIPIGHLT
jgi:hypothetical protein